MNSATPDDRAEVAALRRRIAELEDLHHAIEEHRVDAFVVGNAEAKRVFVLEGADRPYRMLIEDMRQGALTVDEQGLILYCNRQFADLVGAAPESVTATRLVDWVPAGDRAQIEAALQQAQEGSAHDEAHLCARNGEISCLFSFIRMPPESGARIGVIVTDLSDQLAYIELAAAEERARSILEQAGEAMVVVDGEQRILQSNAAAEKLAGRTLVPGTPFDEAFELRSNNGYTIASCLASARGGGTVQGMEFRFVRNGEAARHVLLSVGTLHAESRPVGHVISITDITERKALERELRTQAAELRRADRRKDAFLAMLSHELRSPLASIRNAAELLRQRERSEATEISCGVIDRQVGHLAGLLEELLDVSRIAHGKVLLRKTTIDLVETVALVANDHRAAMSKAGLDFAVELPPRPVPVHADPTRVTQMLGNLLHNALKFTDRGGRVTVRLEVEDGRAAALHVTDTGIGIAASELAHVFMPFEQVHPSRGGLGLGLALVKGLAELHGGTVVASSAGPGQGASFTVRLPAAETAATPEPENGTPAPRARAAGSRILIIEDHHDSADTLRFLLQMHGQQVEVARSGEEGLELAQAFRPDIVLCDLTLEGGISGYEVARRMRADQSLRSVRLIALSGHGSEDDLARTRALGFDLHMVKPIDFGALQRTLGLDTRAEGEALAGSQ